MPTKILHKDPLIFDKQQKRQMDHCLMRLADSLAAPLVMVTDISGQLILYRGRLTAAQSTGLAALAAGSFAAGHEIGRFLGLRDKNSFRHQLLEGGAANLYTVLVGAELLLIIAFTAQTTLGLVRLFAQRTQEELLQLAVEANQARELNAMQNTKLEGGFSTALAQQLDDLFTEG